MAKALKLKIGDKVVVWRSPVFPDCIMTMTIAVLDGDAIGMHSLDIAVMNGDFDGDFITVIPVDVLGPTKDIPFPDDYDDNPPEGMIMYRETGVGGASGVHPAWNKAINQMVFSGAGMDSRMIGRVTRVFDRFVEAFVRLDILDREDVQEFLRMFARFVLQPFIDGLKHSGKVVDLTATVNRLVEVAKENWEGFDLNTRSLAHSVATRSFPIDRATKIVTVNATHPLAADISSLGALSAPEDFDADDPDARMIVDINKVIATIKLSEIDNPFLRVIFEEMHGVHVGTPENVIHNEARNIVSTVSFMRRFSAFIGVHPDRGTQMSGTLISALMDIWMGRKRAHGDMETAQQMVNRTIAEAAPVVAERFGISKFAAKVLMTIVFLSYRSRRMEGLYGSLFAFDGAALEAARMMVDGSWMMWIARCINRDEEAMRREEVKLGLEPGTLDALVGLGGLS